MNLLAPVKDIMSKDLVTVHRKDDLLKVEEIFKNKRIHHLPVVEYKTLVGMISKSDFLFFKRGFKNDSYDEMLERIRLKNYKVEDIMSTKLAKLSPDDRINVALEIFNENLFHAIPIVEEDKLVGILTTFDILHNLAKDRETESSYK